MKYEKIESRNYPEIEYGVAAMKVADRDEVFTNAGGNVTDAVVWAESWDENVYRLTSDMLRGGLVVDVGANIGAFTLLCLALNPDQRVLAIEPHPSNREILRLNIAVNNWSDRVTLAGVGVGADDGSAQLRGGGGAATMRTDDAISGDGVEVAVTTLPALVPDGEIDVLKIDCEGCEWAVFEAAGMDELLARTRWLVGELHTADLDVYGRWLAKLARTHSFCIIGTPAGGGQVWAHRHDV